MGILIGTVQTRMSYSNLHMMNARRLAVNIHDIEAANTGEPLGSFFEGIQSDILPCIMSAAAAVEAYVNEVIFEIRENRALPAEIIDRLATLERNILNRLAMPPLLIGKPGRDKQTTFYKKYELLVQLRNKIIHFAPEWLGAEEIDSPHTKLSEKLKGEFSRSALFPEPELLFPRAFMCYNAAKWATTVARDFVIEYSKIGPWRCGISEIYNRGQLDLP